jgi:hypothetical protein
VVHTPAEAAHTVTAGPLAPDCRDGKHQACCGIAWDDATDRPVNCHCECCWHTNRHTEVATRDAGKDTIEYVCVFCQHRRRTQLLADFITDPGHRFGGILTTREVNLP